MSLFYKIPINFDTLVKGGKQEKISLENSIAQFIMMIITSSYGEISGRYDFGTIIWDLEFNQLVKVYEWEEKVRVSIQDAIEKYEKRLTDIEVTVKLSEMGENENLKGHSEIRRQALIYVYGSIKKNTEKKFRFNTRLYVSPLSQ